MFVIQDRPNRLCDGISRRELLRIGGLNLGGLSLAGLLGADKLRAASPVHSPMFGRAKNILFLWLQGGPPQHETFDPKPDAPLEIRGPFKPISTNIPGIQFSELLPRTAAMADKLAIVRSMATDDNNHDISGYWLLTGYKYLGATARAIKPTDWPYFGSIVKMLKPSDTLPPFSSVWLPDIMRLNDNVQPAGQTAGFLGKQWEPERLICDPAAPNFRVESLSLQRDVPAMRFSRRESLLTQVERHFAHIDRSSLIGEYDRLQQEAFGLLTSGKARKAFALDEEPAQLRDRYGRTQWGQSVLLGRRLIEAGVRLVHVNWCREPGDNAIDNPMWDTHSQNEDRVKEVLCPQFDQSFTALLEDMDQRGLLQETLVVAIGEFGRTPKINKVGGRDHWGPVFSFALAGAGIAGGQVYGSSDKNGAYPASQRVEPPDFTATMFHLLGIPHESTFPDREGRPMHVTKGEPLYKLLGSQPATPERTMPGGDVAHAAVYDPAMLIDGSFESTAPLLPALELAPYRCWQVLAGSDANSPPALRVLKENDPRHSRTGQNHIRIGWEFSDSTTPINLIVPPKTLLTQKLSSPRVGRYRFSAHVTLHGSTREYLEQYWLKHFTARLVLFGYRDLQKDPRDVREFASTLLTPTVYTVDESPRYQRFEATASLRSQEGGANETSNGIGVAVLIEPKTSRPFAVPSGFAWLRIDDVDLDFNPRPRDESVMI
ncbi:MAG: DUF1501 domain-containing protein [Planctomycetales bacterium]